MHSIKVKENNVYKCQEHTVPDKSLKKIRILCTRLLNSTIKTKNNNIGWRQQQLWFYFIFEIDHFNSIIVQTRPSWFHLFPASMPPGGHF